MRDQAPPTIIRASTLRYWDSTFASVALYITEASTILEHRHSRARVTVRPLLREKTYFQAFMYAKFRQVLCIYFKFSILNTYLFKKLIFYFYRAITPINNEIKSDSGTKVI